jgi:hypothetical protein
MAREHARPDAARVAAARAGAETRAAGAAPAGETAAGAEASRRGRAHTGTITIAPGAAAPTASARRAGRILVAVVEALVSLMLARRARAYRRRADRLSYAAEAIGDREPCRDISAERNELRRAASLPARLQDIGQDPRPRISASRSISASLASRGATISS